MWSKGLSKDVHSLSPILFSVFINGLLVAVEQAGLGIKLSDGGKIGGLLFEDDFVRASEQLQRVIDVVHSYRRKRRLKANVSKRLLERVLQKAVVSGGSRICRGYQSIHTWGLILLRVVHGTCI